MSNNILDNSNEGTDKLKTIKDSMKRAPIVKYTYGLLGVATIASLILGLFNDPRIALWGCVASLFLTLILIVLSKTPAAVSSGVVAFFTWSMVIAFVLIIYAFLFSIFLGWPVDLRNIVGKSEKEEYNHALSDLSLNANNFIRNYSEVQHAIQKTGIDNNSSLIINFQRELDKLLDDHNSLSDEELNSKEEIQYYYAGCLLNGMQGFIFQYTKDTVDAIEAYKKVSAYSEDIDQYVVEYKSRTKGQIKSEFVKWFEENYLYPTKTWKVISKMGLHTLNNKNYPCSLFKKESKLVLPNIQNYYLSDPPVESYLNNNPCIN